MKCLVPLSPHRVSLFVCVCVCVCVAGDGGHSYDLIACALGVTVEEVEDECENGLHKDEIVVIARR